jgi:hypothetical protein
MSIPIQALCCEFAHKALDPRSIFTVFVAAFLELESNSLKVDHDSRTLSIELNDQLHMLFLFFIIS